MCIEKTEEGHDFIVEIYSDYVKKYPKKDIDLSFVEKQNAISDIKGCIPARIENNVIIESRAPGSRLDTFDSKTQNRILKEAIKIRNKIKKKDMHYMIAIRVIFSMMK